MWAQEGMPRLGRKAERLIEQAAARDTLRVSVVTVVELSTLSARGRIHLAVPVHEWVEAALETPGVRLAELTAPIAVDAGQIPRTVLSDPMDRLVFATARRLGASLVTADRALLALAKATGLKAVDAAR